VEYGGEKIMNEIATGVLSTVRCYLAKQGGELLDAGNPVFDEASHVWSVPLYYLAPKSRLPIGICTLNEVGEILSVWSDIDRKSFNRLEEMLTPALEAFLLEQIALEQAEMGLTTDAMKTIERLPDSRNRSRMRKKIERLSTLKTQV
jgi:hypothetical protein